MRKIIFLFFNNIFIWMKSKEFIEKAKKLIPRGDFYTKDFIDYDKTFKSLEFTILSHKNSFEGRELNFKFDPIKYNPEFKNSFVNGATIIDKKIE